MAEQVVATEAALAALRRLTAEHGKLMLFQSGGCCDGSSPMCLPEGELLLGPNDLVLGEVGGADFLHRRRTVRTLEPAAVHARRLARPGRGLLARGARRRAFRRTLERVRPLLTVRSMVLPAPGAPLEERRLRRPELAPGQLRLRIHACGVCRTDLHVRDGELPDPKLPLVLGHEVVGSVLEGGDRFAVGERIGVPWLGWTCGECRYCRSGRENLCDRARFTGYTLDGGYAEEAVADERYCFAVPGGYSDAEAAPLLCAGLIGYRALRACG